MFPSPDASEIVWVDSPAKLNLFLHILGRYPNGYHRLQSLFQILDAGDAIGASTRDDGNIVLVTPIEGVPNSENLVVKAARLLKERSGSKQGCNLYINKKLPMGGGIGGGSSNAASVLHLLNILWKCRLSVSELSEIGLQLGADVPVFVHGKTAFANGVGEDLIAQPQPEKWFLVATPELHVSTAEIFSHPNLVRNSLPIKPENYHFETTRNDCETLVSKLHPQVANLLQWLLNYAPSRMTGTGASVFGIFETKEKAQIALENLPNGCSGFIARGVNDSPLHSQLKL